jgi:hypothetical protein
VVALLIRKQPADVHFWILGGDAPAFLREEGQFYEGGPIWRVDLISPSFPRLRMSATPFLHHTINELTNQASMTIA